MSNVKRLLAIWNPSQGSDILSRQEAELSLNFLNLSDTNAEQIDFDALERRHGHHEDLDVDQTILQIAIRVVTVVADNVERFSGSGTEQTHRARRTVRKECSKRWSESG